jgi:DNA polymerase III epsilon subunit-like protein
VTLDGDLHPFDVSDDRSRFNTIAITAFWGNTRLVVVDVETVAAGDDLHAVSVATVICRAGRVRTKWQSLLAPDVPVDPDSSSVHGLTDDHLAGEATFADVAHIVRGALTPVGDEKLVFVAHNVAFDVSVLRAEFARIGEDIPELPVLDTQGKLAGLVGVRTKAGCSLRELCEALAITHARPHDALDDAIVCAEAAVELLNRAAVQDDLGTLDDVLAHVSGDTTTRTLPTLDARIFRRRPRARTLPQDHIASHAALLGARAGRRMLADWRSEVAECARLRCRHLDDRVANAGPPAAKLIPELEAVLKDLTAEGDTAGAATLLGALVPLLPELPARKGRLGQRNALLAWAKTWRPRLDQLGHCPPRDRCPACRRNEPCPLDVWTTAVGTAALGDPDRYARGFFETTGREAGTGAYTQWCAKGLEPVADEALVVCARYWRSIGQATRATQLFQLAWAGGCRHPEVADAYAGQLAAAGRVPDLRSAIAVTKTAARRRDGSTHEGWTRLQARTHQLQGQLQRRQVRPSGRFDKDGNPIPVRRHHPDTPRRTRAARFARAGTDAV